MANMLRIGEGEIIRPDPDGQYRLKPCDCENSDVAYIKRIQLPYGVEYVAVCISCGRSTRAWPIQHHAQIEFNGRELPSWERD